MKISIKYALLYQPIYIINLLNFNVFFAADVEGDGLPTLVMLDDKHDIVFASMVPKKGECEYAIKRCAQHISKVLGYKKIKGN